MQILQSIPTFYLLLLNKNFLICHKCYNYKVTKLEQNIQTHDAANKGTFLGRHLMTVRGKTFGDKEQYVSFFHPQYGHLDGSSSIPPQLLQHFYQLSVGPLPPMRVQRQIARIKK